MTSLVWMLIIACFCNLFLTIFILYDDRSHFILILIFKWLISIIKSHFLFILGTFTSILRISCIFIIVDLCFSSISSHGFYYFITCFREFHIFLSMY